MPPFHLFLALLAVVLFILAGILEWPRNPPAPGYGHPLVAFGLACLTAALTMVP